MIIKFVKTSEVCTSTRALFCTKQTFNAATPWSMKPYAWCCSVLHANDNHPRKGRNHLQRALL